MARNNLICLAAAAMLAAPSLSFAQTSDIPRARKTADRPPVSSTRTPSHQPEKKRPRPDRADATYNPKLPVSQQLHSPIRWYAIENENNSHYWKHVNTEQIWLELEVGVSLDTPELEHFINQFEMGKPVRSSMHPHLTNFYVFEVPGTTPDQVVEMARTAMELPGVMFLEPTAIRKGMSSVPNDPLWSQQWGPYAIFADEAWEYGAGGNSLNVIAVVDDAIDWTHEDLFDQVWYGYDYGQQDANPGLDGPQQTHGTHVTGIIAATRDNEIGMAGMVNDTVYFAKVTDDSYWSDNGSYSASAIVNAIYDIAQIGRVSVVNLSLGGGAPSAADEQAYNHCWNNGKLPIVASGNDGVNSIAYPAAYSSCMAVGSIGTEGTGLYLTAYSNYGIAQEVTAPGGDMISGFGIVSTMPDNQYEAQEGTSMACPHVAGLAGLMKSVNDELTNADIRAIINATCFDFGLPGWDSLFGHGMVNAALAMEIATGVTSSTSSAKAKKHLKLYPNPATDRLWIQSDHGHIAADLEIFDLSGKTVRREVAADKPLFSVGVGDLPHGVYIVRLSAGDFVRTERFVKVN